jgi:hypothetical protein
MKDLPEDKKQKKLWYYKKRGLRKASFFILDRSVSSIGPREEHFRLQNSLHSNEPTRFI